MSDRVLVVAATAAEVEAVLRRLPPSEPGQVGGRPAHRVRLADATVAVVESGIGPIAAAAAAGSALAAAGADLALSVGLAGSFRADLARGRLVIADVMVAAELGVETDDDWATLPATDRFPAAAGLPRRFAGALTAAGQPEPVIGTILTVATVTGTARRAAALAARFPDAIAEAMEGAGVAHAAGLHGIPVGEVRAVCNAVGPRDRENWSIAEALDRLATAMPVVLAASAPLPVKSR